MSDYGLPDDLDKLKDLTKTVAAKEDEKFERLFKKIRKASNIACLDKVLQYLLSNKYTALEEEIRKIL